MPATDYWNNVVGGTSPAENAFAITTHNTNELAFVTRGLYVGVSGDVSVVLANDDNPVTFVGLAAGMIHPIRAKIVRATGTTATDIIGVY